MIRKFGSLAASPDRVRDVFEDVEAWPKWMPDVRAIRVVERSEQRLTVDVDRGARRRVRTTRLEHRYRRDGYMESQIRGPARRWEADWRFTEAPDGDGTVVSCRLDLDLGLVGLVAPRRSLQRALDRTFDRILSGARRRLRSLTVATETDESARPPASHIQIFETAGELEIWIDGRRYVAIGSD